MMRVLLNASPSELKETSGDMSHLRDLIKLPPGPLQYATLNDNHRCLRNIRKIFWHLGRWWVPQSLRRVLFASSQRTFVPSSMIPLVKAEVFHTHLSLPWNSGTLRRHYPMVFSSAGISPPEYYRYIGRGLYEDVVAFYQLVGRVVDVIIVWTHSCARRLKEACPDLTATVHVVPPFYQLGPLDEDVVQKPNSMTRFLFIGKEPIRKGLLETVEAFRQVADKRTDVVLDVVSCDIPGALLEEIAKCPRIKLHNRLTPRAECLQMMRESDVIVLPTHAETIGTVLVEGMARRCVAITCDYEPMNEVVPDGKVGFTVARGDSKDLAEKMCLLTQDRGLLERMQENARNKYLETYGVDVVVPKLIAAYQEAIERWKHSRN